MLKLLAFLLTIVLSMYIVVPAFAQTQPAQNYSALNLPPEAATQDIVSLGTKTDPKTGRQVQGVAFIQRAGQSSPIIQQNSVTTQIETQPTVPPVVGDCYSFYGAGVKWKTSEPWVFNATNSQSMDPSELLSIMSRDINNWEDAADGTLGDGNHMELLGNGSLTTDSLPATFNGVNEVTFVSLPNGSNILSMPTVWYFKNDTPLGDRSIVEWDLVFNENGFLWSIPQDPNKYNFENAATHELGHVFGLTHPTTGQTSCNTTTMFASMPPYEIEKIILEAQDVKGIWQLYVGPNVDSDSDGFADYKEQYIGTTPFAKCGANAYPPDVKADNFINSIDLMLISQRFTGNANGYAYDVRYDMDANGVINSADLMLTAMRFGKVCP